MRNTPPGYDRRRVTELIFNAVLSAFNNRPEGEEFYFPRAIKTIEGIHPGLFEKYSILPETIRKRAKKSKLGLFEPEHEKKFPWPMKRKKKK